jgi:hypothetical protein
MRIWEAMLSKPSRKSLADFVDGAPEFNLLSPIGGKGL